MEAFEYQGSIEQFLCEKATLNCTPINAILELTPLCNMNCDMCYIRLNKDEMHQKGQLRSAKEWIDLANHMKDAGTLFVLLTGGEPLAYPDFKEVYLALKKMGMILTINTNGTLIDKKWADFFKKYPPRRINITLYGKDEKTYKELCHYTHGFQKTLKALQLLKERNVDIKVNGSITPANIDDLNDLVSIVESMKIPWKFDTYMYPVTREREQIFNQKSRLSPEQAAEARVYLMRKKNGDDCFREYAREFLKKSHVASGKNVPPPVECRAGRSSFIVNWQGMMRPCVMMSYPEVPVFETGFKKGWQKIVEEVAGIRLNLQCNVCAMREVCQRCAACVVSETGDFDGVPEYMCQYTEATIKFLQKEIEKAEKSQDVTEKK